MKKNRVFKIIISVFIMIIISMSFSQLVPTKAFISPDVDQFKNEEIAKDKSDATKHVGNIISSAINITQIIGAGVAIIMLIVLGIRWVGESPSGKAEVMKLAKYYVIGAIIIFAAIGLLQVVKSFTQVSLVDNAIYGK